MQKSKMTVHNRHSPTNSSPIPAENKVFVGNLSYFCTHDDLTRLFEPFGSIRNVYICRSKEKVPLYYGFAYFETAESASNAIQKLNGKFFLGRYLRLNHGEQKRNAPVTPIGVQILVSFLSDQSDNPISETLLFAFLSTYGDIEDCVVKGHHFHNTSGYDQANCPPSSSLEMLPRQGGYGFVWFRERSAAERVVQDMNNVIVYMDGARVLLDCKFSNTTASTVTSDTTSVKHEEDSLTLAPAAANNTSEAQTLSTASSIATKVFSHSFIHSFSQDESQASTLSSLTVSPAVTPRHHMSLMNHPMLIHNSGQQFYGHPPVLIATNGSPRYASIPIQHQQMPYPMVPQQHGSSSSFSSPHSSLPFVPPPPSSLPPYHHPSTMPHPSFHAPSPLPPHQPTSHSNASPIGMQAGPSRGQGLSASYPMMTPLQPLIIPVTLPGPIMPAMPPTMDNVKGFPYPIHPIHTHASYPMYPCAQPPSSMPMHMIPPPSSVPLMYSQPPPPPPRFANQNESFVYNQPPSSSQSVVSSHMCYYAPMVHEQYSS